jgi:hypothetical protein
VNPSHHESTTSGPGARGLDPRGPGGRAIERRLGELRRLLRSLVTLRGISLLTSSVILAAVLSFAVDRVFRLSASGRAFALAAFAGALIVLSWRILWRPLRFPLTSGRLADLLEKNFPQLGDELRSAVEFSLEPGVEEPQPAPESGEGDVQLAMKRQVIQGATARLKTLPLAEVANTSGVAATLLCGVAALTFAAISAALLTEPFVTWLRRNVLLENVEWPYRTRLLVEGFPEESLAIGMPRGDPLTLRVRTRGEVPTRVRMVLFYPKETRRFNLAKEGQDVFVFEQSEVTEPLRFVVEGGDFRSREHSVFLRERPEIEKIQVSLEYPRYTRKDPVTLEEDIGEIAIPEGTRLGVEALASKPLEAAWLETEGKKIDLKVSSDDPRHSRGQYIPEKGGTVTVHLRDTEGVPPNQWLRFVVTPVPDRLPTVLAQAEGIGSMITPMATLPFKVKVTDDYGVTALGVDYEIIAEKAEPVKGSEPFGLVEERTTVEESRAWEIAPRKIATEQRLDVRIYAMDNDGLRGAKKGLAATQSFLVVSAERLLEEFLRREEEQRRVLERCIGDERTVRDSVYRLVDEAWKIEGSLKDEVVREMVGFAKTERQLARQMVGISAAMKLILDEMRNNKIAEARETERLAASVIGPLEELAEKLLPTAAVRIGVLRELARAEDRTREGLELAADLEAILAAMDRVLSSMKRIEGFTEVINRLRSIMKIQDESTEEARKAYRRAVEQIFEDEEEKAPPPKR